MKLNENNYFSAEADSEFISVSQIKRFISTPFHPYPCEAEAMAELRGEIVREKTSSLLVGGFVDAKLTGTDKDVEQFIAENPEMISSRGATKGMLKSEFAHADKMVERVKRDAFMMRMLDGDKQRILTGQLFGVPTKIKMDCVNEEYGFISDLKTVESINKMYFDPTTRQRLNFVSYFDYVLQGAVYTEIYFQNTGKRLPFYLVAVSKEAEPDIAVIEIDALSMHERLFGNPEIGIQSMKETVGHINALKLGEVEPIPCGICEYCRRNKVITTPVNFQEIGVDL